jgi:hypothetical protein
MVDDYPVKSRSNQEIRELARKLRDFFSVTNDRRVDVIACLRQPSIWTVRGVKRLNFLVRPDPELGTSDGSTTYGKDTYGKDIVTIAIKQSVYDGALVGEGRSRNTFAHELGHGVMHDGERKFRRAEGNVTPEWLRARPFQSAEHQAKIFAPAFLINDSIAETLSTAEEISIEMGVSLQSATIYFEQLTQRRNRKESAERVMRSAVEFRALTTSKSSHHVQYIDELCPACGKATLIPVGIKFMCQTCNNVFDRFQDGDSVG